MLQQTVAHCFAWIDDSIEVKIKIMKRGIILDEGNGRLSLGERLRNKRNEHGLSQEFLAKKLHVTRQTISGWEHGRSEPDIASLQIITEVYGISMDELLDNVVVEQPYNTLKKTSIVFLILGFVLTGFVAWGSFTGRCGFMPLVMCCGYCVIVNLIVWFTMTGAIKSGDVNMLAGFDAKIDYHMPTLRKVLDAQRFWIVLITVITCLPFAITVFWPIKIGFGFIVAICISHIIGVIIGLEFIAHRYDESLYIDSNKSWTAKASNVPLYLLLGSMFLTLIFAAIGIEIFGLQNNTIPALLFALIMTFAFIVQIVCFAIDMKQNRRLAEKSEKYRPRKAVVVGYLVSFALDIVLLLICAM